jgi:hypothetical protein
MPSFPGGDVVCFSLNPITAKSWRRGKKKKQNTKPKVAFLWCRLPSAGVETIANNWEL